MNEDLNKVYKELNDAFKNLSTEQKRDVIIKKLDDIISVLNILKPCEKLSDEMNKEYKNEDEYLIYLNDVIYNLENNLGNLFTN